jgi:hypothetical protein
LETYRSSTSLLDFVLRHNIILVVEFLGKAWDLDFSDVIFSRWKRDESSVFVLSQRAFLQVFVNLVFGSRVRDVAGSRLRPSRFSREGARGYRNGSNWRPYALLPASPESAKGPIESYSFHVGFLYHYPLRNVCVRSIAILLVSLVLQS